MSVNRRRVPFVAVSLAIVSFVGGVARHARADAPARDASPAEDGQELLNDAINAKLEIDDIDDFGRVLDLCKKAIDRGLDEGSKKFADDLYTGTLIDRAAMLTGAIVDAEQPDPNWRRIRAFAMRDLNEVVARDPGFGTVHLMIARLEQLPGGNRDRARAAAEKALELLGDDQLPRAQAHLVLAALEEDPDRQLRHYDEAVDLSPGDADVRRARGLHLLMQDECERAREDLEAAIAAEPDDASLHEALGMACLMGEQFDAARLAFDKAIELNPDAAGPLLQRGRVFAVQGDREKALADIDRAIDLAPRDPSGRLLRARILQQAGQSERALADVDAVLEQEPDMPAAVELKGLIAAEREDYPEAIRAFRRLAAKNPDDPVVLSQLGMLYLAAKQPREAIRRFTKALEADAEAFAALRGRSDAEISIGDHVAAIADLEKAHALKPDDTGILNNLAWLLATSPNDAIRDGGRAISLAEKACAATEWKEAHIISTLAAGHAEKGDFDEARKYSRRAVDADAAEGGVVEEQLRNELASYEAEKPWRERQEVPEGGESPAPVEKPKPERERPTATAASDRTPRRPFDD